MRASWVVVAVLLSGGVWLPEQASAQGMALGLDRAAAAQRLADRALDCLRRGEEAATKEQKQAAYEEGLALAEQAVQADETNADAHFAVFANRGRLMLLRGVVPNPANLLNANVELERTLELDPNHADALAARGGLYRQLPWVLGGSLEKAEKDLTRAVTLNPAAVGARLELARTYRDMGKPERGRRLLEEAARLAAEQGRERELSDARRMLAEMGAKQKR